MARSHKVQLSLLYFMCVHLTLNITFESTLCSNNFSVLDQSKVDIIEVYLALTTWIIIIFFQPQELFGSRPTRAVISMTAGDNNQAKRSEPNYEAASCGTLPAARSSLDPLPQHLFRWELETIKKQARQSEPSCEAASCWRHCLQPEAVWKHLHMYFNGSIYVQGRSNRVRSKVVQSKYVQSNEGGQKMSVKIFSVKICPGSNKNCERIFFSPTAKNCGKPHHFIRNLRRVQVQGALFF